MGRKFPRMKCCEYCGETRFLRHFRRTGRGKALKNWFNVCKFCEIKQRIKS